MGGARPRCALWLVEGAVNPRASPRAVLSLRGALGLGRLRPLTPAEGRGGEGRGRLASWLRERGSEVAQWPGLCHCGQAEAAPAVLPAAGLC